MSAFKTANLVVAIHNAYLMGTIDLTVYSQFIRRVRNLEKCKVECDEVAHRLETLRSEYDATLKDIMEDINYDTFR